MRHCLNEDVRLIMEELQGATVNRQNQAMPTPGKAKAGQAAQQVASGVQATADQAAQAAAAAGDATLQAQLAQQQGIDPKHAAQVNKAAAAQPRPGKISLTAQARDRQNDNMDGRKAAVNGQVIKTNEDTVDSKSAAKGGSSPDKEEDFNDDPAAARAAERAEEMFAGSKNKKPVAGYGKTGAGRPQGHHEVTHPCQTTARHSEKTNETVHTDEERTKLLDEVFGA